MKICKYIEIAALLIKGECGTAGLFARAVDCTKQYAKPVLDEWVNRGWIDCKNKVYAISTAGCPQYIINEAKAAGLL